MMDCIAKLNKIRLAFLVAVLMTALNLASALADSGFQGPTRFFYSGDGRISLQGAKSGASFDGRYRLSGAYDRSALETIYRIFDATYDPARAVLSLRLLEFLDFLEDRLSPGTRITVLSGYRSPAYNTMLRKRGALAASASLHQYGMAVDLKMDGVLAAAIWEYVKTLRFGGAGYYHDESVHVDVGPARSWDEKTSGVGTDISSNNKLISLVAAYDRYLPGETIDLRFVRMTAFPIGISPQFRLERQNAPPAADVVTRFQPAFYRNLQGDCPQFNALEEMEAIRWQLPDTLPPGRYRIRAQFCGNRYDGMPTDITTPEFQVGRSGEDR